VDKLRVGIVGLGRISLAHIVAAKASADLADLVAVVSRRREVGQAIARMHGIGSVYESLDDALASKTLDAVVLCSPNHLHAVQAIMAASAGCHVLVEKPFANTVGEAKAMIDAATEHKVTLMVGQCRRFTKAVLTAKQRLGEIGEVYSIVHTWSVHFPRLLTDWWSSDKNTGGFVLGLNAPHVVDTMLWFLEQRPTRVQATVARHSRQWEGEDEAAFLLEFPGGAMGVGHLSVNATPGFNDRFIVGARGTMRITDETHLVINGQLVVDEVYGPYLEGGPNYDMQMREFLTAIRAGRQPMASASEVLPCVEVLEAIRRAAKEGGGVTISG
jgi:predicted dehydrogenase